MDVIYYLCGFLCLAQMPIIEYWRSGFKEDENLEFYLMCAIDPIAPFLAVLALTYYLSRHGYTVSDLCYSVVFWTLVANDCVWCIYLLRHKRHEEATYISLATVSVFAVIRSLAPEIAELLADIKVI